MAVAFTELEGSPDVSLGRKGGIDAVREFKVAWGDRFTFARELTGGYIRIGDVFTFTAPTPFPGLPRAIVENIKIKPFDPKNPDGNQSTMTLASTPNNYTESGARVIAQYKSIDLPGDDEEDIVKPEGTTLAVRQGLASEVLTLPVGSFKWEGGDDLRGDLRPGIIIPTGSTQMTWDRVANPPWSTIRQLRGQVNKTAFAGAAKETLLFLGAETSRQFTFDDDDTGGSFWQVVYNFAESSKTLSNGKTKVGWNHFYSNDLIAGEHWVKIINGSSGKPPYIDGDMADLFKFAA